MSGMSKNREIRILNVCQKFRQLERILTDCFLNFHSKLYYFGMYYFFRLSRGGVTVQSKSAKNTSPPMHCCHSQAISTLAVLVSMIKKVAATKRKPYFLMNSLVDL